MGSICRLKNATKNDKQCGLINIDHLKLVQYKNEKREQSPGFQARKCFMGTIPGTWYPSRATVEVLWYVPGTVTGREVIPVA